MFDKRIVVGFHSLADMHGSRFPLFDYDHKRRRRGAGGLKTPKLGRNPFHSGKYSERTIGNSEQ